MKAADWKRGKRRSTRRAIVVRRRRPFPPHTQTTPRYHTNQAWKHAKNFGVAVDALVRALHGEVGGGGRDRTRQRRPKLTSAALRSRPPSWHLHSNKMAEAADERKRAAHDDGGFKAASGRRGRHWGHVGRSPPPCIGLERAGWVQSSTCAADEPMRGSR